MSKSEIIGMFFALWFITIPLTIYITYTTVTEILDLVFNSVRIDRILRHSDQLDPVPLEDEYRMQRERQQKLNKSIVMEVDRQVKYQRLQENKWSIMKNNPEHNAIIAAKQVSDIFKIQ